MPEFTTIEITLKNGKCVLLRQATTFDAEKLLKTIEKYIPQSEFIPLLKEELTQTVAQNKEWISSFIKFDNSLLIVAEYDNEIIGNIDLTGSRRKIMEHTALIGMGMLKEWRDIGLGTALISVLIEWATDNPALELLWLQVYTDNQLGIGLYEKMGFIENGVIKGFFKQNGQYFDNLTMSKSVK
jgi:RimJ/RimL family protein N-acetyltransferase